MSMEVILDNASLSLELVLLFEMLSLTTKSIRWLLSGILSAILVEILLLSSVMVFQSTVSICSIGKSLTFSGVLFFGYLVLFFKFIVSHIWKDLISSVGSLHVRAGHEAGCESIIHAMHKIYEEDESEVILLVDAFNSVNRKTFLHNIGIICQPLAKLVRNCDNLQWFLKVKSNYYSYSIIKKI